MKVKILPEGFPLYKKHDGDAGYDLCIPEDVIVYQLDSAFVDLKVAVKIPDGMVGFLVNRSSLAVKFEVVGNFGVIDSGYTGSLRFKMFNLGTEPVGFVKGDRIAQLIVVPFYSGEIEYVMELEETDRGDGGFGSSGRMFPTDA